MADRVAELKRAALDDGHAFFAVSALTGAGLQTLMLACGERVAELRRVLSEVTDAPELEEGKWERRRQARDRRFEVVREDGCAWRVVGRGIERRVVQTDWENEEAVIYLQHRLERIGVDDALRKAGCKPGDEVRILGYSFDFEGAEELEDDEYEDDGFDYSVYEMGESEE